MQSHLQPRQPLQLLQFCLIVFFLFFYLITNSVSAMSIFDAGKMCTFSNISGVILNNGKPVAGATVVRTIDYEKKQTDETITDENGYFELPALFTRSIAKLLPQEFVVGQTLTVVEGDEQHEIWSGVKRKKEENSESKGKPLVVTCDLNDENSVINVDRQPFITKCNWDLIPDKSNKGF